MMTHMQRRKWAPDPTTIADQLIADYRNATQDSEGDLNAISTMESWAATAEAHGDEFTDDD
jgi:hypothetical protein